jgi:hypothetical protein
MLVVAVVVSGSDVLSAADEPPSDADAKTASPRFVQLTQRVADYTIMPSDFTTPFKLVPSPILKWTNPIRQTEGGAMYLWTDRGAAAAAMCAFWRSDVEYSHEFQSISEASFQMTLEGEQVWRPRTAGVKALSFPREAALPVVANGRASRLTQMRRIAQEYTAYVGPEEGTNSTLRLLSHPLYRYPDNIAAPDLIDGGLFAFVQATDPEVLLLVEAHRPKQGQPAWRIAIARMSRWALYVQHDGKTVWKCVWKPNPKAKDDPYVVLSYAAR